MSRVFQNIDPPPHPTLLGHNSTRGIVSSLFFPAEKYCCTQSTVHIHHLLCRLRLKIQDPYSQRVCPPPAPKAGGTQSSGSKGGWGSIFWKDERHKIGLLQYTLRVERTIFPDRKSKRILLKFL